MKYMSVPHIRDYQGKHIHMIGIGGSSMSGLAQMLQEKGYVLTGSDGLETYATRQFVADTDEGRELAERIQDLTDLLEAYRKGVIVPGGK